MRYKCSVCGSWVKDKFIFGLLHFCLTQEEQAYRELMQQRQKEDIANRAKILGRLGLGIKE